MLRCSACNTFNPSDHTFCGYCGSRLFAPSGNDQPLPSWLGGDNDALPTAQAQPADTTLPPWLATPADHTNITQPISTTQADEDAADEHAGALRTQDITQASDADDASALPPWLSSPTAPTTKNDVPDWLHTSANDSSRATNTSADIAAPPTGPQPATVTDDALPDWLFDVDTASANVPVLPEQASPAATTATDPSSNMATSSIDTATPPASEESLDWLLNPQQAAEPTTAAPPSTDTLPDWLRDDVSAPSSEPPTTPPTNQSDLPSWLRDETPTTLSTQRSTTNVGDAQQDQLPHDAATPTNISDSLPAWLRDDVFAPPSEQGRTTTPLPVDEPAADTNNVVAQHNNELEQEALPAWLRDDPDSAFRATPAADAQASAPSSADQGDVPAWLRDDANTATIETAPHIDSMALPLIESEPLASADLQGDATTAESASSPATTARVYDVADDVTAEPVALVAGDAPQQEPALASSATSLPEPVRVVQPTVYDAPQPELAPPATEDDILAAITQPAASATPATPVASAATPVAPAAATPSSTQAPERAPNMSPPPRAQRGNGLWIMLIIVLLLALLAVGWLALQFNGIL